VSLPATSSSHRLPRRTSARVAAAALPVAVAAALLTLPGGPAHAVSPDVVISEVYGGGGNSGATLRQDFIELYNGGTLPVDVSGWSVQYASASGATYATTALNGTIEPGAHYLVGEAVGAGGTQDLPTPDATGTIAMSGTAGKVALVTATASLTCGTDCDSASSVRDFVGYGSANDFEGTAPAPGLGNTTSDSRSATRADTDQNGSTSPPAHPTRRTAPTTAEVSRASTTGGSPRSRAPDTCRRWSVTW